MGVRGLFAIVVGAAALVLVAPAAAVLDATFAAGVLTVTGDSEGDTVSIACPGDEVVVDGASMPDEPIPCADVASIVVQPGGGDDTVDLQNVTEDVFTGLTGVTVNGGAGNDFITGSPFEDEIEGGADDDTLFVNGTDFDDEFVVTATDVQDVVSGRDDSVTGLEFFSFDVGIGVNRVDASAGPGNYTMFGDTDSDELIGGSGDDFIDGGDGADVLIGGGGSDTVKGEEGADELGGGDGADVLTGGVGNDVLDGGDGADTFQLNVGDGADGVAGGGGFDELVLDGSSNPDLPDALTVRNADLTLGAETSTHAGVELVHFRAADGDDVLDARGASVPVEFVGGAGDDDLFGGQGNDLLFGDDGFDRLDGGPGVDELYGDTGADLLNLEAGADVLDGGGSADLYEVAFALRAITATIDDSGADGDDELTVADFCSTLTIAEDLAGTWTVTKKTTGSKVEATGLEGDPTCATDPSPPSPPPPTPPPTPTPPPPASPPPPPPSATPPPPASPPPAQPGKPTVKRKVVKITICHRRKTIKVTKAQLKKHLKHKDQRGACKPKKKTTTKKR